MKTTYRLPWAAAAVMGLAVALPLAGTRWMSEARADDPAPATDPAAIDKLVEQLGAPGFDERAAASRELERLGRAAEPALRKALDASKDPEVRWRLEQLLLRLEGAGTRALGGGAPPDKPAPDSRPGPTPPGGVVPVPPGADDDVSSQLSRIERIMRDLEEQMARRLRGWQDETEQDPSAPSPFGRGLGGWPRMDPFGGMGLRTLEVPGLTLSTDGMGPVTLRIKRDDGPVADRNLTYRGWSLDDILAEHPELQKVPHMDELKAKVAEQPMGPHDLLRRLMRPDGSGSMGFGIEFGKGLGGSGLGTTIIQDGRGVKVVVRRQNEKGEVEEKTYEGQDLEALKAEHPELAEALGGMRFEVRSPRFFWGDRDGDPRDGLEPLRRDRPVTPPSAPAPASFGAIVGPLGEGLATQLRLADGVGVLVHEVVPGSAAAALGVKRFDVIVAVDGQTIRGPGDAPARLGPKADPATPLELLIVRGGEQITLKR
ncbi:MAG: PDZ domain-containing protein [Planctomycetes bacterium]|nr:PDZ domain-containing protein [Planctomycetota bacterium]MCB9830045.1 PDZ domain-containing protein [Planctomycetota bacterium]MCB9902073.1 PDZ domain-containing protein [Planctomycetota bacterium]